MAKNTDPIYPRTPRMGGVVVTAANTRSDGVGTIGTDIFLMGSVSSADGGYLRFIEAIPTASVAATSTTATVARFFASTVSSGATTAANTDPIGEIPLATQIADSSTTAVITLTLPVNKQIPAGRSLLVTNHAAPAANTGWKFVAYWGDYDV